jgi:hypothetical protein
VRGEGERQRGGVEIKKIKKREMTAPEAQHKDKNNQKKKIIKNSKNTHEEIKKECP